MKHGPRQPQASCLRDRPPLRILDQFEVDIVGEPEDPPNDFCGREPDGVLEQPGHISLPFSLQTRSACLALKQRPRIGIAFRLHPPQFEELARELAPDILDCLKNPRLEHVPLARRPLVTGGRQVSHQEIGDNSADIEAHAIPELNAPPE